MLNSVVRNKCKFEEPFITDVFKQFCKERHNEDKGRNYNTLQEIYSNTELFDLSYIDVPMTDVFINEQSTVHNVQEDTIFIFGESQSFKDLVLPFANNFIHYGNMNNVEVYIYVREFNPQVISGTLYLQYRQFKITANMPFQIFTDMCKLRVLKSDIKYGTRMFNMDVNNRTPFVLNLIIDGVTTICNLPTHTVVADKTKTPKNEYFRRKGLPTIKREQPPIYYVLDKKEEVKPRNIKKIKARGKLEFTHSFQVRSHWRKISSKSLGKDRNGEYKVKGMTFVKSYVKGTGELARRIRIVK